MIFWKQIVSTNMNTTVSNGGLSIVLQNTKSDKYFCKIIKYEHINKIFSHLYLERRHKGPQSTRACPQKYTAIAAQRAKPQINNAAPPLPRLRHGPARPQKSFFPRSLGLREWGEAMGKKKQGGGGGGDEKALLWRLPEITSNELGKIGPAFGLGIGCGAGAGVGFFGGKTVGLPSSSCKSVPSCCGSYFPRTIRVALCPLGDDWFGGLWWVKWLTVLYLYTPHLFPSRPHPKGVMGKSDWQAETESSLGAEMRHDRDSQLFRI